MYLLELSMENPELAEYEAITLLEIKENPKKIQNFLVCKEISKKGLEKIPRMAYTKKFYNILFNGNEKDFEKKMQGFGWQEIYKNDFLLRIHGNPKFAEAKTAGFIWNKVKNPKVNLENPKTKIVVLFFGKQFYCCLEKWKNKQNFFQRRAQNRPEHHPSSLDPKLARCMVNISGSNSVVDPFCGSGGILIESAFMGLETKGSDFDRIMVNRAKINLKHYGIKDCNVEQMDALKAAFGKNDAIVADFPYGKNTKVDDIEKLLFEFLKKTKNKVVLGLNDSIPYKKIIKNAKKKIAKDFSVYIHKSLTKKILIIS